MLAMWPPLACPTGEYSTTPALVSALTQQVGPVSTDWPLWAVREGDARRVAVTLGEGLWRWRMQDLVRHDGESVAFDELVNRTLQYLSSRDDVKRLRVRVPERLDEDLRCEWVAEVYDASLSPTVDVEVTLELTKQNGQPTVHRFVENPRGTDFNLDLGMLLVRLAHRRRRPRRRLLGRMRALGILRTHPSAALELVTASHQLLCHERLSSLAMLESGERLRLPFSSQEATISLA